MQSTSEPSLHEVGEVGETARSGESSSFFFHGEMQDSVAESNDTVAWGQECGETDVSEQQRLGGPGNGGDQDAANSLGSAAIKMEPEHWTNDLERMDVDDGGIPSSTLPHVSEPRKEPLQGPTEKMQLGFEGQECAKYPGFIEDKHGQGHLALAPMKATDSQRHEETINTGVKGQVTTDMGGLQNYQAHSLVNSTPLHHSTPGIPTPFGSISTPASYNSRVQSYPHQQFFTQPNQVSFDPSLTRQQQLQVLIDNKERQIENVQRMYEQGNNVFKLSQSQADVPTSILMGPLSYQRAPQSAYRTLPCGNGGKNYQSQSQSEFPYDQTASKQPSALYSPQSPDALNQTSKPNQQPPNMHTTQEAPAEDTKEEISSNDDDEDDEPLKIRLARHPSKAPSPQSPNPSPINWKLPDYDIHFSPSPPPASSTSKPKPAKDTSSLPVAKISLPGLIREPLVLSPDHTSQELHLLTHIFLPGQQALATPDPEPALAVLNFHSIAMMVVEAFVQYEIGDEMGRSGPLYRRDESDSEQGEGGGGGKGKGKGKAKKKEEEDYVRIRCARTANVDDIFFAVIDRWRAGLESNKRAFKLIRGIQEFVDVALDVIFWIKENGLLAEEEEAGRKEGAKRGAKSKAGAKGKAEEEVVKKVEGVSMLTARKKAAPKARVEKPKKKETPAKKRRVPVTPGVTVVRKK